MKKQLNVLPFLSTDWQAGGSHRSVTPSSTNSSTLDWRNIHHGYLLGDSQLNPWNMQQYIIHRPSYRAHVYVVSNRVGEPTSKISLLPVTTSFSRSTKLLQQSQNVFSNQRMKKNEGYPWLPKKFLQQSKNEEEWLTHGSQKNSSTIKEWRKNERYPMSPKKNPIEEEEQEEQEQEQECAWIANGKKLSSQENSEIHTYTHHLCNNYKPKI